MLKTLGADLEPAWAGRMWYGSVFGAWSVVGAVGIVLTFMKPVSASMAGTFRFFVGACYLVVFVLALYSFVSVMKTPRHMKKLSYRFWILSSVASLPWIVRFLLQ